MSSSDAKTPQVYLSACCRSKAIESSKENPQNHDEPTEIYVCSACRKECEVSGDPVCEYCLGKGEVLVEGRVYPNEPHTALIDTEECECIKNQ